MTSPASPPNPKSSPNPRSKSPSEPLAVSAEDRALAFLQQGRLDEAEALYRGLIAGGNGTAIHHGNLASIHGMRGRLDAAIAELQIALELRPDYPEAWNNLGVALKQQGKLQAAIKAYSRATRLKPAWPEALFNLGVVRKESGDLDGAITAYEQALECRPHYPEALNNLANALKQRDQLDAAMELYRRALEIQPHYRDAHHNLGNSLHDLGQLGAAQACFERALQIDPQYSEAQLSLALVLLLQGDYPAGWRAYAWRLHKDNHAATVVHGWPRCRLWDGRPLPSGEPLLLVSEQGLGDTLQFMRYLPLLRQRGFTVRFHAHAKLHGLIRSSGIDPEPLNPEQANGVRAGAWIPLLSLPQQLGISPANPLVSAPYLRPTSERIEHWRARLAHAPRPLIAINWQGNPKAERNGLRGRSLPLAAFAPIAASGIGTLVSLQKGAGSEQLATCPFRDRFIDCQAEIDQAWDFGDAAAIIANCDLVVSSDTAIAHLAGGLGIKTWLLLHHIPEWRWGLKDDRSFWYPSMRLFRQTSRGDWAGVIGRVVLALQAHWPEAIEVRKQKAHALLRQDKPDQAEHQYRQLLEEGHESADLLTNLGVICGATGRLQEASELSLRALKLQPNNRAAITNMAEALRQLGELEQLESQLRDYWQRHPGHDLALDLLRSLIHRAGRHLEAASLAEALTRLDPQNPAAHYSQGVSLKAAGKLAEARACYERVLELNPDHADGASNLSLILLLQGDYPVGLALREARLRKRQPVVPVAEPKLPRWDPKAPLPGPLLVVGEQGLGDMIQFLRYVPALKDRFDAIHLCLPEKLHGLAKAAELGAKLFTPEDLGKQDLPKASQWVPLLSIPWHLGITPEQPGPTTPYLLTTPDKQAAWQEVLATDQTLVAVHWQGNKEIMNLEGRSLPLDALSPLASVENTTFLSLQKGYGSDQLARCSFRKRFHPRQKDVDKCWDFVATGAMLQACDLLITSDSAIAHLAGGLGIKTWLLLHHIPDWRWGLKDDRSFWYPSMRLFRQTSPGDWAGVIGRVRAELDQLVATGTRAKRLRLQP